MLAWHGRLLPSHARICNAHPPTTRALLPLAAAPPAGDMTVHLLADLRPGTTDPGQGMVAVAGEAPAAAAPAAAAGGAAQLQGLAARMAAVAAATSAQQPPQQPAVQQWRQPPAAAGTAQQQPVQQRQALARKVFELATSVFSANVRGQK